MDVRFCTVVIIGFIIVAKIPMCFENEGSPKKKEH